MTSDKEALFCNFLLGFTKFTTGLDIFNVLTIVFNKRILLFDTVLQVHWKPHCHQQYLHFFFVESIPVGL